MRKTNAWTRKDNPLTGRLYFLFLFVGCHMKFALLNSYFNFSAKWRIFYVVTKKLSTNFFRRIKSFSIFSCHFRFYSGIFFEYFFAPGIFTQFSGFTILLSDFFFGPRFFFLSLKLFASIFSS